MNDDRLCAAIITSHGGPGESDRIALLADRRLSVAALAALLQEGESESILTVVSGIAEVRATLDQYRPQVIVADGTWAAWPAIRNASWGGRVLLLLDAGDEDGAFTQAVKSGADGYLSRSASRTALEAAIETLRRSRRYLDPLLEGRIRWALEEIQLRASTGPMLSDRELEIIAAIARGRSSKEIARECSVTAKTVCNHVSNIYRKLEISDRGQLVLYAAQQGMI